MPMFSSVLAQTKRPIMRTNEDMLEEIETANDGEGPTPLATYTGTALNEIMDAVEARGEAEDRISHAVDGRAKKAQPGP